MTALNDIRQILSTRNVAGCACGYCVASARRYVKTCDLCGFVGHPVFAPCACGAYSPCRPNTKCEEHGVELCAFCGGNGLEVDPWQIVASIRVAVGDGDGVSDPIDEEADADTLRRLGYAG